MEDKIIELLCINAYQGYCGSLNGSEIRKRQYHWYTNPRYGDLVMEISTIHNRENDKDRIGYLKAVGNPGEFHLETLDGREYRWHNADVIRIPQNMKERRDSEIE